MKPLVAIVGRPNVGKSTLFNRIAGRHLAIVEDVPGVTRDRHYAEVELGDKELTVVDTGGFFPGEGTPLERAIREQAQLAVDDCYIILFVVDGREGLTAGDQDVAASLRRSGKPVVVAVNKLDSERQRDADWAEFHRLGFADVFGVSAEHGLGVIPLEERLYDLLPAKGPAIEAQQPGEEEPPVRVAIVGRPNVGKSTLVNALLGTKRLVASELPGTTRDAIDSELEVEGRRYVLTDTAGIRRKRSIAQRVESFAVVAALKAIDRSDVAVVLLDATEPAVDQDARIAGIAEEKGRALVIVVNKWDKLQALGAARQKDLREELKHGFRFVSYAPVVFTSALTGAKVEKVLEVASQLRDQLHFRAPTPQLNRLLEHITENHPAPVVGGRPLRLYYIAQVGTEPPAFAITANRPAQIPDRYKRYVLNQLRATFDLRVPIRVFFRERPGQKRRAARKRPS